MKKIKRLFITGYRSFELGILKENDPRIAIIKKKLEKEIIHYIESGLEWVLIGGNLGIEIWAGETVSKLKINYSELKLGLLYPFAEFGENWNPLNNEKLKKIENSADFIGYVSKKTYYSAKQMQNHTDFILKHSDASLIVYDQDYEGKTLFFFRDANYFSLKNNYIIRLITMDDLQNSMEN